MTTKLRKCGNCGERAVAPVVLESYKTTLEHDGQSYDLELVDFQVDQCANCKTIVTGENSEEQLSHALRAAADVLTPAQIRERRKSLNLTQAELAEYLRLSPFTISRWESGAQIQQRSMDVLLRAFFEVREFRVARKYPEPQSHWQPAQVTMSAEGGLGAGITPQSSNSIPQSRPWKLLENSCSPVNRGVKQSEHTNVAKHLRLAS